MSLWPGDKIGERFTAVRMVAYQGRAECVSWQCTRRGSHQRTDGTWEPGECYGWHCSLCDAPCSMMGHDCPRAGDVA